MLFLLILWKGNWRIGELRRGGECFEEGSSGERGCGVHGREKLRNIHFYLFLGKAKGRELQLWTNISLFLFFFDRKRRELWTGINWFFLLLKS